MHKENKYQALRTIYFISKYKNYVEQFEEMAASEEQMARMLGEQTTLDMSISIIED